MPLLMEAGAAGGVGVADVPCACCCPSAWSPACAFAASFPLDLGMFWTSTSLSLLNLFNRCRHQLLLFVPICVPRYQRMVRVIQRGYVARIGPNAAARAEAEAAGVR